MCDCPRCIFDAIPEPKPGFEKEVIDELRDGVQKIKDKIAGLL
jgi:hypothetical protein